MLLLLPKNGFGLGESHKTLTQSLKFAGFSLKIACFFPKNFLLLPVSLTARFYYIKNLVAAFSSLVARFLLFRVLLLPGSTVFTSSFSQLFCKGIPFSEIGSYSSSVCYKLSFELSMVRWKNRKSGIAQTYPVGLRVQSWFCSRQLSCRHTSAVISFQ